MSEASGFLNNEIAKKDEEILTLKKQLEEKNQALSLAKNAANIVRLQECLIWLRDNIIHGNAAHVARINNVLGG